MNKYVGIDQSKTSTGFTVVNEDGEIDYAIKITPKTDYKFYLEQYNYKVPLVDLEAFQIGLLDEDGKLTKKKKDLTKPEKELLKAGSNDRCSFICDEISTHLESLINDGHDVLIACEGISFGGSGQVVDLSKLLGMILRTADLYHIPTIEVPPTSLKKFVGKGNYSKEEMIENVPKKHLEKLNENLEVNKVGNVKGLDDIVDSYWLAQYMKMKEEGVPGWNSK